MSVEISGGTVAEIVINDRRTRNALGLSVIDALKAAVVELSAPIDTRAIVIAGANGTFSSGANVKEDVPIESVIASVTALFDAIDASPKPVIARVEGACLGLAVGLVAACDIVVAAKNANFALPEPRMGQVATLAAVPLVSRLGRTDASHYLLTGDAFDGDVARAIGLATVSVDEADMSRQQEKLCDSLIRGGPDAIAASKRLIRVVAGDDRATAFSVASEMTRTLAASSEAAEGALARAERRQPNWTDGLLVYP